MEVIKKKMNTLRAKLEEAEAQADQAEAELNAINEKADEAEETPLAI